MSENQSSIKKDKRRAHTLLNKIQQKRIFAQSSLEKREINKITAGEASVSPT